MLVRESDGYYRTRWTDRGGRRRARSFGRASREARARYAAFLEEQAGVHPALAGAPIRNAVAAFLEYARGYYPKGSREPAAYGAALRFVVERYPDLAADRFRPRELEAARENMIQAGLIVSTVNAYVRRIRHTWKWLAAAEYVSPAVWWGLRTIRPLVPGRTAAATPEPVEPVAEAVLRRFLKRCRHPDLEALIRFQLACGCRPGEACGITSAQVVDRDQAVWTYRPKAHKNVRRGRVLDVLIGPRAQRILAERFARHGPNDPLWYTPTGRAYTSKRYQAHVRRVCVREHIPHWHPHQLRHNAATRLRGDYGLDVAQTVLGHAKLDTTQVYAAVSREKAVDAVRRTG